MVLLEIDAPYVATVELEPDTPQTVDVYIGRIEALQGVKIEPWITQTASLLLERPHALACKLVGAFVFDVPSMALDPMPLDLVAGVCRVQRLP